MKNNNTQKQLHPFFYLLIGFIFLFFSNGRWILPIAAVLSPIFLIRFLRFQKPFVGFLIIVVAGWASNIFIWKEMMPMSGFFYYFISLMMSVFTSLTFLIDRIYTQKVKGFISTLIFPSIYVVMEYIVVSTNPSGSYGTFAHTQTSLPLIQLISITGIWGVTFLITWFASIINWLWDNSFGKSKLKRILFAFGIPFIFILLYGQIRLRINIQNKMVRIASINIINADFNNHFSDNTDTVDKNTCDIFLQNCRVAASTGAKIIFGAEAIIEIPEDTENKVIEKARITAHKDSIYLGVPICIIPNGFPEKRPDNKIVWISPKGEIIFTYHKSKPTPGEGSYGDGIIKYFDSPYGRIGSAICFDMDFPSLIKQTGKMDIDIMLIPGNDSREIAPYHTYVSSFRAVEQGFNMVRSVSRGLSASFNYKGQTLSSQDYFNTANNILYSDIPTKGCKTIYSVLGDYFAWLCILFFVISMIIGIRKKH